MMYEIVELSCACCIATTLLKTAKGSCRDFSCRDKISETEAIFANLLLSW